MALIKSIAGNEVCDQTARNTANNIKVGGRNLLLKTGTPYSVTGNNSSNQCVVPYSIAKPVSELSGKSVCMSCHVSYSGSSTSGQFRFQGNGPSWVDITGIGAINISDIGNGLDLFGTRVINTKDTNIQIRIDDVSGTLTFSNMKYELGNKATDWTPAPEDCQIKMIDDGAGNVTIKTL